MTSERFWPVLKIALVAGLAAGLFMGLFHLALTEPVIDRAIALEDAAAMAPGQEARYEPLVSRALQKAMLVAGSALYGLLAGIIFGFVFRAVGRRLPGRWPEVKAGVLAGLLWWSVALLPFLKYPANPPGVGDPETVAYRQGIQLAFMGLSVLAVAVAFTFYRLFGRRSRPGSQAGRLGLAMALYAVLAIVFFLAVPANPDPVAAPADLVWHFRILSLSGQTFLWAVLGAVSAMLLGRLARRGELREGA